MMNQRRNLVASEAVGAPTTNIGAEKLASAEARRGLAEGVTLVGQAADESLSTDPTPISSHVGQTVLAETVPREEPRQRDPILGAFNSTPQHFKGRAQNLL